jgi:hypothetical protein
MARGMRRHRHSDQMNGWFCTSCKSLNQRGSKRCYSCGQKQDFLPTREALVPSDAGASGSGATASGAAAGPPSVVVSSNNGVPAGPFATVSAVSDAGLAFAGDKSVRRRRRPGRARILLLLALTLVVAGVTAAGVLSPPDWMRASANPAGTQSPKDR